MHQEEVIVLSNESRGGQYFRMVLKAPCSAAAAAPGQFIHIRCSETADPLLRRPFSVYDADPVAGTISILYAVVGRGTELLSRMKTGAKTSVLAALGQGFAMPPTGSPAVLVGGGVGIAPLLFLGKELRKHNHPVTVMLGMQSDETAGILEDFKEAGLDVQVATDDGSLGACGHVSCLFSPDGESWQPDCYVYACGPVPMLVEVQSWALECGVEAQLSLEERMGCGVGVCLSCVCKVKVKEGNGWEYKRVCVEGPVFSAREVILDE